MSNYPAGVTDNDPQFNVASAGDGGDDLQWLEPTTPETYTDWQGEDFYLV